MINYNKIKVVSDSIGEFEVTVTNEQLDKLIVGGAKTLNQIKGYKERLGKGSLRRPGDSYGSVNSEGGFTGNSVDWTKYFPKVTSEEIDKIISEALEYERKIKAATNASLVLVGVGLSATLTGNPTAALGLLKIIEIVGSYFSDGQNTIDNVTGKT